MFNQYLLIVMEMFYFDCITMSRICQHECDHCLYILLLMSVGPRVDVIVGRLFVVHADRNYYTSIVDIRYIGDGSGKRVRYKWIYNHMSLNQYNNIIAFNFITTFHHHE